MTDDRPPHTRVYAWALRPDSVRKFAYERGLRLRKARGTDTYALEHPDGRLSARHPIEEIFDVLSAPAVTVGGEDFGSAYVWVCSHHGPAINTFLRHRALIRGEWTPSRGEIAVIASLRPQNPAPSVEVRLRAEIVRTAVSALLVA